MRRRLTNNKKSHWTKITEHVSGIASVGLIAWPIALVTWLASLSTQLIFVNPAFNDVLMSSLMLLPIALLLFLPLARLPLIIKLLSACVLGPLSLIMALVILMSGPNIPGIFKTGLDYSNELMKSTPFGRARIAIYRTNGGATTDFGISVIRDQFIFPGIKHIESLDYAYNAYDAQFIKIDQHHLRCHIDSTRNELIKEDTIITDK